jgi:hypothetical protein
MYRRRRRLFTSPTSQPRARQAQQKAQERSYGTCLHTIHQYETKSALDGSAECAVKFPFVPNAGYSFTVSKHSYHSASSGEWGERRTIMLNWYRKASGGVAAMAARLAEAEQARRTADGLEPAETAV